MNESGTKETGRGVPGPQGGGVINRPGNVPVDYPPPPPILQVPGLGEGGGDLTPPPLGALAYYVCRVRPPPYGGAFIGFLESMNEDPESVSDHRWRNGLIRRVPMKIL